jgi:cell division protein FtsX
MSKVEFLLSGIEEKSKKVMHRCLELQESLKLSKNELTELIQINEENKRTIKQLEEKIRSLVVAKTIENKEGTIAAKTKITELVREIDKCMGLLNT